MSETDCLMAAGAGNQMGPKAHSAEGVAWLNERGSFWPVLSSGIWTEMPEAPTQAKRGSYSAQVRSANFKCPDASVRWKTLGQLTCRLNR